MKRNLLLLLLLCLGAVAQAQTGGIWGEVFNKKGEPLFGVSIQVTDSDGRLKSGSVTDLDGRFLAKPFSAGCYDVKVSFDGYVSELIRDVPVEDWKNRQITVILKSKKLEEKSRSTVLSFPEKVSQHTTFYVKPLFEKEFPMPERVLIR